MAYRAIYRRWRPKTFDDVIGQEHITTTLKNQVINGSCAHAYLFCGTRGTGKTSTAKILARAVNCLNPQNGNPCNNCEICRGLQDESILDVTELDGASKNKVENIREIIDDVMFLPSTARKKVYIIDEVHMVTPQAFNALLKTLEEPPAHVMFILATTELNKVPITVLSRCQQFDFRRITNRDIADRMETILSADNVAFEPAALNTIAELGDGSMRDALSILDKCVGAAEGTLTYDTVLSTIGVADHTAMYNIAAAVCHGDSGTALSVLADAVESGKEIGLFAENFLKYLRDLLLVRMTNDSTRFLNTSAENAQKMEELAAEFTKERLMRAIDLLCDTSAKARYTAFSRTLYEMAVVKMCDPETEDTLTALKDRINVLEDKLKNGTPLPQTIFPAPTPQPAAPTPPPPTVSEQPKQKPVAEKEKSSPVSNKTTDDPRFAEVLQYVRTHGGIPIVSHLSAAQARISDGKYLVVYGADVAMSKTVISKPRNTELLKQAVASLFGNTLEVAVVTKKEIGDDSDNPFRELEELSKTHPEIQFE